MLRSIWLGQLGYPSFPDGNAFHSKYDLGFPGKFPFARVALTDLYVYRSVVALGGEVEVVFQTRLARLGEVVRN